MVNYLLNCKLLNSKENPPRIKLLKYSNNEKIVEKIIIEENFFFKPIKKETKNAKSIK